MEEIDLDYTSFRCRTLKQDVVIASLVLPAGYSKRTAAVIHILEAFDCSHKGGCGVFAERGERRFYNWRICTHPELSKRGE